MVRFINVFCVIGSFSYKYSFPHIKGSTNKRKYSSIDGPAAKQPKTIYPAYFIPELAHVVAMCDEKLPFFALAQALSQRKLAHTGLQVEANSTSLVLKLLTLPMPEVKPTDNKVRININSIFAWH